MKKVSWYIFWVVLIIGNALQLLGLYLWGLKSVFFLSGILVLIDIWVLFHVSLNFITALLGKSTEKRKNYSLSMGTVFVVLLLTEMIMRFAGIKETYNENRFGHYAPFYQNKAYSKLHHYKPHSPHELKTGEYSYSRQTNSYGLSDKEWNINKSSGQLRILCLGDSFTEGDGAPADSSFPALLEQKLSAYREIEVMNAGVCGSDPVYAHNLLDTLLVFRPDIVILLMNSGDIEDFIFRGGNERYSSETPKRGPWWESIYAFSHISRMFFEGVMQKKHLLLSKEEFQNEEKEAQKKLFKSIQAMSQNCSKKNMDFFLVMHPFKTELGEDFNKQWEVFLPLLGKSSVRSINLNNIFSKQYQPGSKAWEALFWEEDGHHNSKGYYEISKAVHDQLVSSIALDSMPGLRQE